MVRHQQEEEGMQWVYCGHISDAVPRGQKGITIIGDAHSPALYFLQCIDVYTQHIIYSLVYHLSPPLKGKFVRMSTLFCPTFSPEDGSAWMSSFMKKVNKPGRTDRSVPKTGRLPFTRDTRKQDSESLRVKYQSWISKKHSFQTLFAFTMSPCHVREVKSRILSPWSCLHQE